MSAAFDTVDHDVLVTRHVHRFGVTGCAIAWIKSYLADRSQSVNINGGVSKGSSMIVIIFTSVHSVRWGGGGGQGRSYAFLNVVYSDGNEIISHVGGPVGL